MKKFLAITAVVSLTFFSCESNEKEGPVPAYDIETLEFEGDEELIYCLGVSVGSSMKNDSIQVVNIDEISAGISDMMNRNEFKYPTQDIQRIQMAFGKLPKAEQTEMNDTVSYGVGLSIGSRITQMGLADFDTDLFNFGITSIFEDFELIYDETENDSIINTLLMAKQQEQMAAQQTQMQKTMQDAEVNFGHVAKEGKEYRAKNILKSSVDSTDSGLQIEVLRKGTGKFPVGTDLVKVHYKGTLINGEVFDSSYERDQPFETQVYGRIIRGWQEALTLMQVGGKYRIVVPHELGYGFQQQGNILPFSTLVFEMELLEIKEQQPAKTGLAQ
jgi:FKBP-type peptidyl-prolyl cis-trans isomerase